jgi:hypothetical protein
VLAFADNLVLVARTADEAQTLLIALAVGLQDYGLIVGSDKCSSFQIVTKIKTWATRHPGLKFDGSSIPFVNPGEDIKYLDMDINPWGRRSASGTGSKL